MFTSSTQLSINEFAPSLSPLLTLTFQGPVSVTVFSLPGQVQRLLQRLRHMRRCNQAIRHNVTFSIVTPVMRSVSQQVSRDIPPPLLAPLAEQRRQAEQGIQELKIRRPPLRRKRWKRNGGNFENLNSIIEVETSPKYSRRKELNSNYLGNVNSFSYILSSGKKLVNSRNFTHPKLRVHANIHKDYRYISQVKTRNILSPAPESIECSSTKLDSEFEEFNLGKNYAIGLGVKYPNNLLRNVAIDAGQTRYVLLLDIDMIPSKKLHQQFTTMINDVNNYKNNPIALTSKHKIDQNYNTNISKLHRGTKSSYKDLVTENLFTSDTVLSMGHETEENSELRAASDDKIAFVLPAYEVQEGSLLPETKLELLSLVEQGKARPFYKQLCDKCQVGFSFTYVIYFEFK